MQLKRQSVEAWQNEKHYSKGNTEYQREPSPKIRNPVDYVKYEDEGQVRSQHLLFVCAVFSLSFQAVVLLNENCNKSSGFFSIKSEMSGWI